MTKALRFAGRLVKHGVILVVKVLGILLPVSLELLDRLQADERKRGDPASDFHHGIEVRPGFRSDAERDLGRRGLL